MPDNNIFTKVQLDTPQRSTFDLSHDHKLSCKMGELVPVWVQDCVPSDKFHISQQAMFRLMPMLAPIMHKVDVFMHTFFVPNRIIWEHWNAFIFGSEEGGRTQPAYAFPVMDNTALGIVQPSMLADYLGLPIGDYTASTEQISALPFGAYFRIWQDYFRDENLQFENEPPFKLNDGVQSSGGILIDMQRRAWEHDYFTSCLPFAQKGQPVSLPLDFSGRLDIVLDQSLSNPWLSWKNTPPNTPSSSGNLGVSLGQVFDGGGQFAKLDPNGTLYGDLDNSTIDNVTTINDLRTAFAVQKWLERNARSGTRYIEGLRSHFGVRSSDGRLQRPEYVCGTRASMSISEVLQTSETDAGTPQGTMAGHGVGVAQHGGNTFYCEEHGYLMTILSIRPKTAYSQGLTRHWSKIDKFDYLWPTFAQLGEQEVKTKELYFDFSAGGGDNNDTFGYLPRYAEYRFSNSRVSGQMRDTLNFWHMGREFTSAPVLDAGFIECRPTKRIFAVLDPTEDEIVAHIYHKIYATRPLPMYGNPGGL